MKFCISVCYIHGGQCQVLTASADQTIRLWDVRQSSPNAVGMVEGKQAVSVEWGREDSLSQYMIVTERSGIVSIYDKRLLQSSRSSGSASAGGTGRSTKAVHTFNQLPVVVDCAIFSPSGGQYVVGGVTYHGEGMADIAVWKWTKSEQEIDTGVTTAISSRYPAHAGPIFAMDLSPDGKRLATGGSDALVGLWDTDSMICTHTFSHPTKLVRSVAFSHDGRILAMSNEENDIFLAESANGISLGSVALGHRRGGAEEVAWHPTALVLACARTEQFLGDRPPPPPIAVAKLNITSTSQ